MTGESLLSRKTSCTLQFELEVCHMWAFDCDNGKKKKNKFKAKNVNNKEICNCCISYVV